ncbi:MAG: hypothetical protein JJ975_09875 [Bacteroidia bacterium]|nr:hypothetical protein [Bacteroidia bacterium]
MKRSKELTRYLRTQGVLNGSKAEILKAKRAFRKRYQKNWAKNYRQHRHEIRFMLCKAEYQRFKDKCQGQITPTKLAKDLVIGYSLGQDFIPNKETLVTVLRNLGLAINGLYGEGDIQRVTKQLEQAEAQLMNYLKPKN